MSDPHDPQVPDEAAGDDLDPTADTGKFEAFARGEGSSDLPTERGEAVGAPFRILTLLAGLVVLGGILWILLR